MKPIKLSIQAFGPFAGKEEIDFRKLGSYPLFLINGPTGAGKSSILDAICFALYAHTTGAERDPQQMRCDHSDPSLPCEVSLEFSLGDKRYRIWRSPVQELPKKSGEGTTLKPGAAKLWLLDGSEEGVLLVSKSVSDATKQISTLIGLGLEQFRQVMVLPQGKFRELLMADSASREAIFSQLFETHIFKRIENSLKEQASSIRQAAAHHDSKVRGILEGANLNTEDELAVELNEISPRLQVAQSNRKDAQMLLQKTQTKKDETKALNQQFDELAQKKAALSATLSRKAEIDAKKLQLTHAVKAQSIHHLYDSQHDLAEKLSNARAVHLNSVALLSKARAEETQAKEHLHEAKTKALKIESLKAQQTELSRIATQKIALDEANIALDLASTEANKSALALEQKKNALKMLAAERTQKEERVLSHIKMLEDLSPKKQLLINLAEKRQIRAQLAEVEDRQNKINKVIISQQVLIAETTALYSQAKTNATQTELAWHQGQAALLAKELAQDQACPVCGSKEHPKPASMQNSEVLTSKEQVDKTRDHESTCRENMQAAKNKLLASTNKQESLQASFVDLSSRLGEYAVLPITELASQQSKLQSEVDSLESLKTEKAREDKRIAEIKAIQEQDTLALEALDADATRTNNLMVGAKATSQQLRSQIPAEYLEQSHLEQSLKNLQLEIEGLSKRLQAAEQEWTQKQSTLDQAIATEKAQLNQLDAQEALYKNADLVWQQTLNNSEFTSDEHFLDLRLNDKTRAEITLTIEQYEVELNSLLAVVAQLSASLKDKENTNIGLIEETLTEHTLKFETADQIWRDLDTRHQHLNSVKDKLSKAALENEALNKQYEVIGTLDKVANGNTGNKISLQRFVLSVLLDDVLIQATQRLHIMSSGRYQLLRKVDRAKGGKASGLELEVQDGDTGKSRSVATLSGGESFMAALSLALGVSDVVQSYAGGIRLDTLFIDEGFGSLDTESLDAAIKVLIDLQATGRMIGIISHVSELKEQMAKRIDVVSSKLGSSISTIS
jgi:exonuclease SbcC